MDDKPSAKERGRATTEPVAEKQREIQREQDRKDEAKGKGGQQQSRAVQTGARAQPEEMPAQHMPKPGIEADMALRPRFEAPDYKGSGKLEGMAALVTGGDSGIGRAVAVLFAREGADVAIVYLSAHEDAQETQRWIEKEGRRCILIPGDVKDSSFCDAGRGAHRARVRQARRAGEQRRVPGARRLDPGHHRRTPGRDDEDQHLRLLLHGARRAART